MMKDKNGIKIECQNCGAFEYCKDSSAYEQCQNKAFFPSYRAYEARIAELQTELNVIQESECVEAQEADRLREELRKLKEENLIRAVNSKVELCFTDEELDLIRKNLQEQIWEDKDGWSAEKKIIAKCTELLKERNK